ncbi:hypothetical protein SLEP1_g27138 [Rubroshorea leprosula]|uniref:DUF4220 domain-containing protein n=1 Tax=Rubroshorea leprosula TaxID=152421 RepID=A0AAV5JWJ2_9ROSI|nr:hypothetical protein SLEP1_g27138 [Rubroshorea leprosula]
MPSVVKSVETLWDRWNFRGLIGLSLLLQSFLILSAPLRKQIGDRWVIMTFIWLAYLLADWVATFTIGLLLRTERSDILTLWAPFLLLHLGGPDTITSFSLGDNNFWIRHLLGLILQVGSTIYVIFEQSVPQNKLLLPTLLVLMAGIIKYAERNCAFYLACFDHYGDKVTNYSVLEENAVKADENDGSNLLKELTPDGTTKNLLVGPLLSPERRAFSKNAFLKMSPQEVLRMIEIELSLLYDALHTKFPIVYSKIGRVFRIISLGCIFGALLSFSLVRKHYKLGKSEIWLTYGLLIGAITLDFISIGLLIFSDFNFLNLEIKNMVHDLKKENKGNRVMKGRRWSKRISQYNFIAYFRGSQTLYFRGSQTLRFIRFHLYATCPKISEDKVWLFIFEELKRKAKLAKTAEMGKQICLKRGDGILESNKNYRHLIWSIKGLDYTASLLTWHLATEFCYLDKLCKCPTCNIQGISKLLSDYMFYLLEMRPAVMATVSLDRKDVLRKAMDDLRRHFSNNIQDLGWEEMSKAIFAEGPEFDPLLPPGCEEQSVFIYARRLAVQLKEKMNDGCPCPSSKSRWRTHHFRLVVDESFGSWNTIFNRRPTFIYWWY